jgi:hypothetical protein
VGFYSDTALTRAMLEWWVVEKDTSLHEGLRVAMMNQKAVKLK